MTVRLWQRNAIGAAVAAVAVAAHITFISGPAWERYQHRVHPAHIAAAGQSVTVNGQTWTVRNVHRSTHQRSGLPLPDGTVLVNVVVQRSGPGPAGFDCVGYLVAGERSWRGTGPWCGAAETSMAWSFLIPAGTEFTAVEARALDRSIVIRFEL